MIKYSADSKYAIYCGYKFRKDPKTGYYLCSKKTDAGKRERLHEYVWRISNGEIPKGYQIHHKDRNKDNNEIDNLELLSAKEHMTVHAMLRTEEEKQKLKDNLLVNAMPKAKEWHSSPKGKEWHSKQGKENYRKRQLREYECTNCGCLFNTKNIYNVKSTHFCSNKCKSAYRRKLGVDNIEKQCQICGKTYIANKYSATKRCEECRNSQHTENR